MAYEPKDLTGSLFKNDRKEKDTHADYRGSAMLNGTDFWIDAWINKDRNGNSYMSLKFKAKNGVTSARHTAAANPATTGQHYTATIGGDDDELPPF